MSLPCNYDLVSEHFGVFSPEPLPTVYILPKYSVSNQDKR